jgi:hypothetical protein
MKIALIALAVFIIWFAYPVCLAYSVGGLSVNIVVEPEPLQGQLNAGETYFFNVTVANDGLSVVPGQLTEEDPWIQYTGYLNTVVDFDWKASGSYDFGAATSGYSTQLDDMGLTNVFEIPVNGSSVWESFNHTFVRDAFDFGVKPYEALEVVVKARVYFEVYNVSVGVDASRRGPMAAEASITLKLLDDKKVKYVEGKYLDMASEVEPLRDVAEAEYLNVSRFMDYLADMNQSINAGDYFSALKTYSKYDDKYRAQLISSLTEEASTSYGKTRLISRLEQELDFQNVTYNILEDKYVSLSRTYQAKQAELEAAKQSLSTAITGVFLASIAFFFVGRRSMSRDTNLGEQTIDMEGESHDSEPGVR